jgi:diguanylate cyclase (GGDEF)-like protein
MQITSAELFHRTSEETFALSDVQVFFTTAIGYFLLAQLMISINDPMTAGASFWPAAGLTLGMLLKIPIRQWVFVIAAIALSESLGNQLRGHPIEANLLWTTGNCIEPLIGAYLIRRNGNTGDTLLPLRKLWRFIGFGVLFAPLIGASIGAMGTIVFLDKPFTQVWPKYLIGDALGVLVVAPVLLSMGSNRLFMPRPKEAITLGLMLLFMSAITFRNWGSMADIILPYLFLPLMVWSALRFGVRGTAWTILLVAGAAHIAPVLGYGPFTAVLIPAGHGVTILQVLLAISSTTALVVAALTHDLIAGLQNENLLQRQAHQDPLTGLYNRAGLSARLEKWGQRRDTDASTLHLLICDLDGFKHVNDNFGHLAGDQVLIEVAKRLQACIREEDTAARIGGDEFVILVNHSNRNTVNQISGRILDSMHKPITGRFGEINTAMSIGIAPWTPGKDIEAIMRAADAALYKAKHEGKNQSVWADELD